MKKNLCQSEEKLVKQNNKPTKPAQIVTLLKLT